MSATAIVDGLGRGGIPRRIGLVSALAILLVTGLAPVARADELAYNCDYDICTIDPDHTATHADLTKTEQNDEFEAEWSPDGSRIAFNGSYDQGARIYTIEAADPEAGATEVIDAEGINGGEPAWSPDGSRIAFAGGKLFTSEGGVYVSPADGTSPPQLIGGFDTTDGHPAWSPDSNLLAFARGTSTWVSAPSESASPHYLGPGTQPAWSPDGTRIATVTAGEPHMVELIPATGGTPVAMPVAASSSADVAWSPDGSKVVYVDATDQVRIAPVDPPGEGVEVRLPAEVGVPLFVSFSPEGDRVAFSAEELQQGGLQRVYVAPAGGGEAVSVTTAPVNSREPVWKPLPGGGPTGGAGSGGGTEGGSAAGGAGASGTASGGSSGGAATGTTTGGGNPPPTRAPVKLKLAAFHHPYVAAEHLGAAYIPCSLGSTNVICHANGTATYVSPITHSLTFARPAKKAVVVAKGSVSVPNGKTRPLLLKLTAGGKKLLRPGASVKLTISVVETAPGAAPTTTTRTLRVTVPKKR